MNQPNPCAAPIMDLSAPASMLAFPPLPSVEQGRVRLETTAPTLPPDGIADAGAIRLGGQAPMFLPDAIADAGLVRLGGQSPAF